MWRENKRDARIIFVGLAVSVIAGSALIASSIQGTLQEAVNDTLARENIDIRGVVQGRDVILNEGDSGNVEAAVSALQKVPWIHEIKVALDPSAPPSVSTSTTTSSSGTDNAKVNNSNRSNSPMHPNTEMHPATPLPTLSPTPSPSATPSQPGDKKTPDPLPAPVTILFAGGGSDFVSDQGQTIAALAEALRKNPTWQVTVTGHTDNGRTAEERQTLGMNRANVVRDKLLAAGVSPQQIIVRSLGATKPVASNATKEGRALNRRVEIVVEVKQS